MEKRYLIIGFGVSGRGIGAYLEKKGYAFDVGDDAETKPLDPLSDKGALFWSKISYAIVSPGVGENSCWLQAAKKASIEIISEASFILPRIKAPLYGITGTNGKTTTTLFIAWALKQKGFLAKACGNVGYSLGEFACECDESAGGIKELPIGIVELSSYQLEDLKGPFFEGGIFLNLSPDHLERHKTLEAYAKAKANLCFCMKPEKTLWVQKGVFEAFGALFNQSARPFASKPLEVEQRVFNLPEHSLENVCASAHILKDFGIEFEETLELYKAFPKPEHRQELAFEIEGVRFINDSKATNLSAVEAALLAEKQRGVWLILGGFDKGEDFKKLKVNTSQLLGVIALGQTAPKIVEAFKDKCLVYHAKDLQDAVQYAQKKASTGESVLLSPGCSSFDMFENYVDRGLQFKYTVERSSFQGEQL